RTGDQDPDPVHDDALDLCLAREVGVAEKLGVSGLLVHLRVEGDVCVTEFLGLGVGLGGLTLTLHELTESVLVDAQALFGGHLQGQIDGETIGVVELEGVRSGEDRAPGGAGAFGGTPEQCRARAQGFGEVLLLVVDHAVDDLGLVQQVGVDVLHRVDADLGQLVQEGGVGTREQAQIADGAAQDTAQDVTGLFVTGLDPVTDEHDGAAHVVGDHTEHDVLFVVVTVAGAGQLRGTLEDTTDDVGLVDVVDVLQDRGEPLQAQACVDVLLRQFAEDRIVLAGALTTLVLHEDEVPDLDVSVLVRLGTTIGPVLGPPVVEDLGAGTTGAGNAHVPVVLLLPHALDAFEAHADLVAPDV